MAETMLSIDRVLIGGVWTEDPSRGTIPVDNPSTGAPLGHVAAASIADADRAVAAARKAFDDGPWPGLTPHQRAEYLRTVADRLDARADEMIGHSIQDLGIPRSFAEAINPLFSAILRNDADLADEVVARSRDERDGMGQRTVILREPGGVAVCIVPWNAPVLLAVTKAGAALMAGCPVIVKVDPLAPFGGLALAEAFAEAGFPEGVISFLPGGRELGEHLVAHPDVDHVSFTGSSATGRKVMAQAAQNLTRVTLELGGKSAGIILDDMDPEQALPILFAGCIGLSGQICTLLSRLLVPKDRYDEWVAAIAAFYAGQTIGHAQLAETTQGPLVSEAQLRNVEALVESARQEGARIVVGGQRPETAEQGWFYAPTLIADVRRDMRIVQEEVFGPVTVIAPYEDVDDAIAQANDTEFGLAGAIFTNDGDAAYAIGLRLRAGSISWNGFGCCPTQPFGGYKSSGMGREGGIEGIEAFLEVKQYANGVGVV